MQEFAARVLARPQHKFISDTKRIGGGFGGKAFDAVYLAGPAMVAADKYAAQPHTHGHLCGAQVPTTHSCRTQSTRGHYIDGQASSALCDIQGARVRTLRGANTAPKNAKVLTDSSFPTHLPSIEAYVEHGNIRIDIAQ